MKRLYSWIRTKIRKITITKRLIIIFMFSTILPIGIICVFSSLSYQKSAYRKMNDSMNQVLLAHNITISRELALQKNFSYNLLVNDTILEVLEEAPSDKTIDIGTAVLKNQLTEYVWSTACENIIITDENDYFYGSLSTDELLPEYRKNACRKLEEEGINDCWTSADTIKGSKVLVFSKKIYSKETAGKLLGYLHMVYDERKFFRNIYADFNTGDASTMFIIDESFQYVSEQHDKKKIGTELIFRDETHKQELSQKKSFIDYYNDEKSLIVAYHNTSVNWYIAAAIPCSYIDKDIYSTMFTLLLLAGIILLCSIIIILMVSSTIISPVRELSVYMEKVSLGDYMDQEEIKYNDEIGKLTQNCKNTVKHLVSVMDENELKGKQQRELELKKLQAQINPHFLFNTLNSFQYIAMLNNLTILDEGIGSLCSLLRQTIMQEDEFITVEQEFENVLNYCKVQEIRYAGRFEVDMDVSEEVRERKVPRMILQPLVENCLVHGMKDDVMLQIALVAYTEGEKVIIVVRDNGKGMEEPDKAKQKAVSFNRIGLKNVEDRLEIIYGQEHGLSIASEKGCGTEIRLIVG